MEPQRRDYLFGDIDPVAIVAAYRCGHCTSTAEVCTANGAQYIAIHHEDGCPVLNCVLPSVPDVVRAIAAAVPETFRP